MSVKLKITTNQSIRLVIVLQSLILYFCSCLNFVVKKVITGATPGRSLVLVITYSFQDGSEDDPFFEDDDEFFAFEDAASEETAESAAEEPKINCDIVPGNLAQFGLFLGRNNSILDLRTIKTGKANVIAGKRDQARDHALL